MSANSLLWAEIAYRSDVSLLPCVQAYSEAVDVHKHEHPVDLMYPFFPVFRPTVKQWMCTSTNTLLIWCIPSSLCSGLQWSSGCAQARTPCWSDVSLLPCVQAYSEAVDVHKHEHPVDLMYPFFPVFRPTVKQWMCTSTNTLLIWCIPSSLCSGLQWSSGCAQARTPCWSDVSLFPVFRPTVKQWMCTSTNTLLIWCIPSSLCSGLQWSTGCAWADEACGCSGPPEEEAWPPASCWLTTTHTPGVSALQTLCRLVWVFVWVFVFCLLIVIVSGGGGG